jgi:hypothetical protein
MTNVCVSYIHYEPQHILFPAWRPESGERGVCVCQSASIQPERAGLFDYLCPQGVNSSFTGENHHGGFHPQYPDNQTYVHGILAQSGFPWHIQAAYHRSNTHKLSTLQTLFAHP